ncbi:MAG TPA: helicase HerA-like domain-containing protein [Xanthobacteraceae bacterium]|jgi:DNA helicase HerA-like ATPase|nr:helicase HerA-like domain-containing protein [Xanthobacteraceae bacterium]
MAPRKRKTGSDARDSVAKDPATKDSAAAKTAAAPAAALPADALVVGKSSKYEYLELKFGNRHGLVTGATGTGKTVSLQVMAEGFAKAGVSVFAADVKGDLSGIAAAGEAKDAFVKRARDMGLDYQPDQFATVFWDVFGEEGHPIRATMAEMGPLLLTRMMDLNDTQEGVLNIAFRLADELGLPLLDLKDLRAMLGYIAEQANELRMKYGNVSATSVGSIQRQLLVLENQGGDKFFGEPALAISDLMRTDRDGRGVVNILAADKLINNPRLYATFLLWLLSELFEQMPEVGDPDKPKLVFFFDEAHLLFNDAPKALLDKIEQVVRLIRSKGVGVFFVTQNPMDVPQTVLTQLGNRVQHALRAFTPQDQKAVRTAAETFRPNKDLDTATVITELGKGEALVSFLEGNGVPSVVQRTTIRPPTARLGTITPQERQALIASSPLKGKYDTAIDSESAYEKLQKRVEQTAAPEEQAGGGGLLGGLGSVVGTIFGTDRKRGERLSTGQLVTRQITRSVTGRVVGKLAADMGKSVGGSMGGTIGRAIVRGVLGGILRR